MAITLDDVNIRRQLHLDVSAAWSPVRIYDDPPSLQGSAAELPRAFVQLGDIRPTAQGWTNSMVEVEVTHPYTITGQFAWPTEGTFEAAKLALIEALLARWNPSNLYISKWRSKVVAINFTDMAFKTTDKQEPVMQVSVVYNVHVNSSP